MLVMGIFAIFMLVKGIRKICGKGGYLEKRKETKLKRDAAKFEKLKSKFEQVVEKDTDAKGHATTTTKEPAKDTHTVAFVLCWIFWTRIGQLIGMDNFVIISVLFLFLF